jgi:histidine ammonia-lyase
VLGTARDALELAREVIESELSACIDNPMIAPDGWLTNNASNGDTTRLGLALDHLADAMGAVAAQAERRIARLLDGERGLPPFLLHAGARPGVDSGLMIAQYAAAAAVADIAGRSGASALRTLPVSRGTEDYNPMGACAAQRVANAVARSADVIAIELLAAAQALDVGPRQAADGSRAAAVHARLRMEVPAMIHDRPVGDDIAAVRGWVQEGGLDAARRRADPRSASVGVAQEIVAPAYGMVGERAASGVGVGGGEDDLGEEQLLAHRPELGSDAHTRERVADGPPGALVGGGPGDERGRGADGALGDDA